MCEFNSYDFTTCESNPQALEPVLKDEFEDAVAIGISTADEYLGCNFEKELCSVYDEVQDYCESASVARDVLNSIFGAVFLLLYPALFWSQEWSSLCYVPVFVWSIIGLYYKVDEDKCQDYLYKNVALFLAMLSGAMIIAKIGLVITFAVLRVTPADIRAESKGEYGQEKTSTEMIEAGVL